MPENHIFYADNEGAYVLKLVGELRLCSSKPLEGFDKAYLDSLTLKNLVVDLSEATSLDSTSLGLLAQIALHFTEATGKKPLLVCTSKSLRRMINAVNFNQLFILLDKIELPTSPLQCLPDVIGESEEELAKRILQAHRVLISLSEKNKEQFLPVVKFLEKELKRDDLTKGDGK